MINSSFITTMPDTWAINKRFVMLAINGWQKEYERVLLGGLTCDSDDYYNSEQHMNGIYLPKYNKDKPLYIGFFNTGAYQETIGGFGGLQHCLIPSPKHVLIDRDEKGELTTKVFAEKQTSEQLLSILGYDYGINNAIINTKRNRSVKTGTKYTNATDKIKESY
jgi:arginine decarboxylase